MLLPPRCVVTGEIVAHQGAVSPSAWASLHFIARPFCACCGVPFEFEVEEGGVCASCLDHPPPFDMHRSALIYNDESRALILGFKHGDQTQAVSSFVPWMRQAAAHLTDDIDLVVPVPLHYSRLLRRRYNQAALMARAYAKSANLELGLDVLKRVRAAQSQGHLKASERYKNVRKAFALNPKFEADIRGQRILLIDDVYTTGATIKACAKTLKKAGPGKVYALTLARVVRDIA